MQLARVLGTVVATVKHESLVGVRLLLIQPQDHDGNPDGDAVVAADPLQAGVGELVEWVTGREAALALPDTYSPVDVAVVAICDHAWGDSKHLQGGLAQVHRPLPPAERAS